MLERDHVMVLTGNYSLAHELLFFVVFKSRRCSLFHNCAHINPDQDDFILKAFLLILIYISVKFYISNIGAISCSNSFFIFLQAKY